MKYLFLLSISPVQSFIEQARKTQGLRAGSQILSDLIDFAIREVKSNTKSSELIFPTETVASKPNRFITILETDENMQEFGDKLKEAVQAEFMNKAKDYLKRTEFFEKCKEQLEDFFKIFWVAKEYKVNEPYEPQHERIEQLLGVVKANRPFKQLAEKGRKCSINGELNVKFYRKTKDETDKNKKVKGDNEKLFHDNVKVVDYGNEKDGIPTKELDAGEGLCAISFLKRVWKIYEQDENGNKKELKTFPSVSEIALMNTLDKLSGKGALKTNISIIKAINEQFFYEESLTEKEFQRILERASKKNITSLSSIQLLQREIAEAAKEKGLQLSKYYAILVFDADNMGSKLKEKSKDYQKALSKCLGDFASKATAYIDGTMKDEVQKGKTVYAGGDDFLGFINLDYLFKAMRWLRENFDTTINQGMISKGHKSPELTFSAGVAIAHYKTPLSEVLTWARASEKKAKEKYKHLTEKSKNAFCLSVLKHSGEIRQSTWKWSYVDDNLTATLDIVGDLVQKLVDEELSSTFIKSLNMEFRKLIDKDNNIDDDNEEVLNFEISRLLLRAKSQEANKGNMQILAYKIVNLREEDNNIQGGIHNASDFMQMLDIVDFLHRKAHIKPNSKPQKQNQ